MTKEELHSLGRFVKIHALIKETPHKPGTLGPVIAGTRSRALHDDEERDLRRALLRLRDDIDEVAG